MESLNHEYKAVVKNIIDENEFNSIKDLVSICNETDNTGLDFSNDRNDYEILKILINNSKNLIAYFGVVCNSNFGKNYAWGIINPNYDEESYLEISKYLKYECKDKNIKVLNLINERKASNFEKFVLSIGGELIYSTYDMKFFKENYNSNDLKESDLILKRATLDDLSEIVPIGVEAFGTEEDSEREYNELNLKDSKYNNFIGKVDGKTIGTISVRLENEEASISDLCVIKSYRGRGFGRAILSKTINYLTNKGIENFALSVETKNKNALELYEDCGFKIIKINDCYEIEI